MDKFIGDNVMAVFGAPVAHEDDPERAVRAAFGMHAAMVELNGDIKAQFGFDLALRVGVNTGRGARRVAWGTPTRCSVTPSTWPPACSRRRRWAGRSWASAPSA